MDTLTINEPSGFDMYRQYYRISKLDLTLMCSMVTRLPVMYLYDRCVTLQ